MRISHEVPLCLLEHSKQYNNYQYCLPHLMDKHSLYRDFFLSCKESGIHIMMDNSLHELGTPYNEERLLYWLEKLQPQEFFIPDYWEDKTRSLVSAKEWLNKKNQFPNTKFIPVVQGITEKEAQECFLIYKNDLGFKKIAFSYGASWYKDVFSYNTPHNENNIPYRSMLGRVEFLNELFEKNFLDINDRIHLLGTYLPQEFSLYEEPLMSVIESIDTSNPIMASIEKLEYTNFGLERKPKIKIDEVMEIDSLLIDFKILNRNILMFRSINKI